MWKLINVAKATFMSCCTNAGNKFQFVLYDGEDDEGYSEVLSDALVMERTTNLNKRIQYPSKVVFDTLLNCDAVEASLVNKPDDGGIKLKLKYDVNGNPMHFEWHIQRMTTAELWETIMVPVVKTVSSLLAQVNELRECVRKKDIEIQQYKIEGAKLARSTVATRPFDLTHFDSVNSDIHTSARSLENIADFFVKRAANGGRTYIPVAEAVAKVEQADAVSPRQSISQIKKESPRIRKRKAQEFAKIHLERKAIQLRKKPQLHYKSSQSQELDDEEMAPRVKNEVNKLNIETEDHNNMLDIAQLTTVAALAADSVATTSSSFMNRKIETHENWLQKNRRENAEFDIERERQQQRKQQKQTPQNQQQEIQKKPSDTKIPKTNTDCDRNEPDDVNTPEVDQAINSESDTDVEADPCGAGDMDVKAELRRIQKSLADLEEMRLKDVDQSNRRNRKDESMDKTYDGSGKL